jgi:MFS family permease
MGFGGSFWLPRTFWRAAKSMSPHELGLATAGMAATNFTTLGVGALLPLIRRDIALNGVEIGAVAAVPSASAAAVIFAAARLVDRYGGAAAIASGLGFIAAGACVMALASGAVLFFAGVALLGVAFGIVNPATNVLATGNVLARRRGLSMGIKQTGVTIGGAAAGLCLPRISAATSWRVAFAVCAFVALAVAVSALVRKTATGTGPLILKEDVVPVGRFELAFYGFAMSGIQAALFTYLTVYLVDERSFSPAIAGDGFAVTLGAATLGRLLWGIMADRQGRRRSVLRAAAGGSLLMLALIPVVPGAAIWLVLAAAGLSAAGWNGVFQAIVAEAAGARGVSRASGFALFFMYAGSIVVPPLLGLALTRNLWELLWWLAAAIAAMSALVMGRPWRARRVRLLRDPAPTQAVDPRRS